MSASTRDDLRGSTRTKLLIASSLSAFSNSSASARQTTHRHNITPVTSFLFSSRPQAHIRHSSLPFFYNFLHSSSLTTNQSTVDLRAFISVTKTQEETNSSTSPTHSHTFCDTDVFSDFLLLSTKIVRDDTRCDFLHKNLYSTSRWWTS